MSVAAALADGICAVVASPRGCGAVAASEETTEPLRDLSALASFVGAGGAATIGAVGCESGKIGLGVGGGDAGSEFGDAESASALVGLGAGRGKVAP